MTSYDPDQSLPYPDLTDIANGPAAFAALIDTAVDKLVKIYSSAADRTVRNPSPSPGEVSLLLDIDQVQFYDGTQWRPMPGQYLGETTTTSGDIVQPAGNHSVLISTTFTAVNGQRYVGHFESSYLFSVGNAALLYLRHAAGGSITTGSTQVGSRQIQNISTTKESPVSYTRTFVASASGTYTAGITCSFYTGSSNLTWYADSNDDMYFRVTAC